jgi:hypothetical protein
MGSEQSRKRTSALRGRASTSLPIALTGIQFDLIVLGLTWQCIGEAGGVTPLQRSCACCRHSEMGQPHNVVRAYADKFPLRTGNPDHSTSVLRADTRSSADVARLRHTLALTLRKSALRPATNM